MAFYKAVQKEKTQILSKTLNFSPQTLGAVVTRRTSHTRKTLVACWRSAAGNASGTLVAATCRLPAEQRWASSVPQVVKLPRRTPRRIGGLRIGSFPFREGFLIPEIHRV